MTRSLLVLLAACGSSPPPVEARPKPTNALASVANDANGIVRLIDKTVMNGGLWFDDEACAKQFGTPGEVTGDVIPAFARCLAGLHLEASQREDRLADVYVMKFAPGFEVEARVLTDPGGPRLTWIGFASRKPGDLDAPTITHDTLEALRLAGDRNGPIDPTVGAQLGADATPFGVVVTWIKVCLDESGAIARAEPYETTGTASQKAFLAAVPTWKFRPFMTRGKPLPVCAMVRMSYPPEKARPVEMLPLPPPSSRSNRTPIVFTDTMGARPTQIAGDRHIAPDDLTRVDIAKHGKPGRIITVRGTVRVCIDETGQVESVLPIEATGFADYDAKLQRVIRTTWRYAPFVVDGQPTPTCMYNTFIYQQR